ncbi:MAG TPA: hypothetical protein VGC78_09060 [Gaiellaceae bacterium]|jgi:hypothetical protein
MRKLVGSIGLCVVSLVLAGQVGAEAQRAVVTDDRKPFFPVMLLDQCDGGAAARAAALGTNVLVDAGCGRRVVRGGRLVGWSYPDEPDNNGWTPAGLAQAFPRRGTNGRLPRFLTTTPAFYTGPDTRAAAARTAAFAALADVAGFDLYPLNHCRQSLVEVYDAQRRFARLARGRPTFQWIETGAIHPGYCGGITVTQAQVTAEAWLAVAGGARGIGFFTHTWAPGHSAFAVSPAVQGAIRRFTALAAAIEAGLTGTTTDARAGTPAIRVLARAGGGRTYVIAVNTLTSVVPATVTVPRLRVRKMRVVGEGRSVTVYGGKFQDTFAPLGVHVYASG